MKCDLCYSGDMTFVGYSCDGKKLRFECNLCGHIETKSTCMKIEDNE
jgi:hypothetical protein